MPRTLLRKEKLRHVQAFETYYVMGDDRSFNRLSKELKINRRTIQLWAASFDWAVL